MGQHMHIHPLLFFLMPWTKQARKAVKTDPSCKQLQMTLQNTRIWFPSLLAIFLSPQTYRSARPCPTLYPNDSNRKKVVSRISSSSACLSSVVESSFASRSAIGTSSISRRSRHEALRRGAWGSEATAPKGEPGGASNDITAIEVRLSFFRRYGRVGRSVSLRLIEFASEWSVLFRSCM